MKKEMVSHKGLKNTTPKKDQGVVLLIAVTISSLILVIGIGIISIVTKEIVLSSLNKNSQAAFFAADSGVDCAMHWDLVNLIALKRFETDSGVDPSEYPRSLFATSTESVADFKVGRVYGINNNLTSGTFDPFCAGQNAGKVFYNSLDSTNYPQTFFKIPERAGWDSTTGLATTTFVFFPEQPSDPNNPDKTKPCALVTISKELILTPAPARIRTEIYSEGFSTCDSNDARRVSRGVKVEYDI